MASAASPQPVVLPPAPGNAAAEEKLPLAGAQDQYAQFMRRLALWSDMEVVQAGRRIHEEILQSRIPAQAGMNEVDGEIWVLCAFFSAAYDRPDQPPGIKLSSLVSNCKAPVRFNNFAEKLSLIAKELRPGDHGFALCIKHLLEQYLITVAVHKKFTEIWTAFFPETFSTSAGSGTSPSSQPAASFDDEFDDSEQEKVKYLRRLQDLAWFLYLKTKESNKAMTLARCYNVMLATVAFIAINQNNPSFAPVESEVEASTALMSLKSPGASPPPSPSSNAQPASIFKDGGAASSGKEVFREIQKKMVQLPGVTMEQLLREVQVAGDTIVVPPARAQDLLHPERVRDYLGDLREEFNKAAMSSITSLDEFFVLYPNLHAAMAPMPPGRQAPSTPKHMSAPRTAAYTSPAGLHTPSGVPSTPTSATAARFSPSQTPITSAMESAQWLCRLKGSAHPPAEPLSRFIRALSDDADQQHKLHAELAERPLTLLSQVDTPAPFSTSTPAEGGSQSPPRMMESVREQIQTLYWRALLQILHKESERLKTERHDTLLKNDVFHRSLLACAAETVLKAHTLVTLTFPRILRLFHISAFEFVKVLESFVQVTTSLPNALKRHLQHVQDMVLEQHAWADTSPLFMLIQRQEQRGLWPVEALRRASGSSGDGSGAAGPAAGPAAATADRQDRARTTSLEMFFSKLLPIVETVIFDLNQALSRVIAEPQTNKGAQSVSPIRDQVYAIVKECLVHHHNLIQGRHIHQIILCTFYGVCKVNHLDPEVKFTTIIDKYKQACRYSTDVVYHIPLRNDTTGDIILFYNSTFIPEVKKILTSANKHPVPAMPIPRARNALSSHRILASNVYLANWGSPPRMPNLGGSHARGATVGPAATAAVTSSSSSSTTNASASMAGGRNGALHGDSISMLGVPGNMTPTTKALYAFGESPSRDLQLINRAVNQGRAAMAQLPSLDDHAPEQKSKKRNSGTAVGEVSSLKRRKGGE
mmetsp:Transcript_128/g.427  ORF Transcript_128/g.427 Transcript_128/m.427 type:complete len:987 (-) Transcript_128:24-2984(-)